MAGLYRDIGLPVVRMIIGEFIREPELAKKYLALMGGKDLELKRWLDIAIEEGRLCHGDSQIMLTTLLNLFHGQFLWPQLVVNLSQPTLEQQECYLEEIVRIFLCAYAHDKHEHRP